MHKLAHFVVVIGLALLPFNSHAVIGGGVLAPEEAASIVNIKLERAMCTGTVLSPYVILTAAHCKDMYGRALWVAHLADGRKRDCEISQVVQSEYYPEAQPVLLRHVHAPDILLLRLSTPLCNVKTAEVSSSILALKEPLHGAGHGRGSAPFGSVGTFDLQVIDLEKARASASPIDSDVANMLSVGALTYQFALPVHQGSSFCYGDSGGPVLASKASGPALVLGVNGAVIGNDKLGTEACDHSYVQVFTPVAPYAEWITAKVQEWTPAN